jgi:hypothetical protein
MLIAIVINVLCGICDVAIVCLEQQHGARVDGVRVHVTKETISCKGFFLKCNENNPTHIFVLSLYEAAVGHPLGPSTAQEPRANNW